MRANYPPPYDLNQMFQILQQKWQAIPRDTLGTLVTSMKQHCLGLQPRQRWTLTLLTLFKCNDRSINTQISILLSCFQYLFVELMITMNE